MGERIPLRMCAGDFLEAHEVGGDVRLRVVIVQCRDDGVDIEAHVPPHWRSGKASSVDCLRDCSLTISGMEAARPFQLSAGETLLFVKPEGDRYDHEGSRHAYSERVCLVFDESSGAAALFSLEEGSHLCIRAQQTIVSGEPMIAGSIVPDKAVA